MASRWAPRELFRPPICRSMKEIDRSFFKKEVPLVIAKPEDQKVFQALGKNCREDLLQIQGFNRIVNLGDKESKKKGILLSHRFTCVEDVTSSALEETQTILKQSGAVLENYTLELDYDFWRSDEILQAILPEDLLDEIPCGFTIVGHIAHMNIRDKYHDYRFLIGKVIYDKNPLITTVVNKLDAIDTKFRTFSMELLAGTPDYEVEQHESGCVFRFNFEKVYWNTRLHTEHGRLIDQFNPGEAVCDVFAGVGPFAVPAGRKGVITFANDLNPYSYECLKNNVKINKVGHTVSTFCEDGRVFIQKSLERLAQYSDEQKHVEITPRRQSRSNPKPVPKLEIPKSFDHYVMNLPDTAIEFLDGFIGLYKNRPEMKMPLIHVHCFHKADPMLPEPSDEEVYESLRQRVSTAMNHDVPISSLQFHKVRKVAPTKTMYCISMELPKDVALA